MTFQKQLGMECHHPNWLIFFRGVGLNHQPDKDGFDTSPYLYGAWTGVIEVWSKISKPWLARWRLGIHHDFRKPHMLGIFSKWLVGGFKQFFLFRNIWDNPSHWLIFFQMVKTTNQMDKSWFWCLFHSGLTHTRIFVSTSAMISRKKQALGV